MTNKTPEARREHFLQTALEVMERLAEHFPAVTLDVRQHPLPPRIDIRADILASRFEASKTKRP
jgi:hypothetical protein